MALGVSLQNRVEFNVPTESVVHSFSIFEYRLCTRTELGAGDNMLNKTLSLPSRSSQFDYLTSLGDLATPTKSSVTICCRKDFVIGSMHTLDYRINTRCLLGAKHGAGDAKCPMEDTKKFKMVSETE